MASLTNANLLTLTENLSLSSSWDGTRGTSSVPMAPPLLARSSGRALMMVTRREIILLFRPRDLNFGARAGQ